MSGEASPAIEVTNLTKSFGSFYALRGLSLSVATGECVTIFGPNGAGKSTFLKILSSISRPTDGQIRINDYQLKEHSHKTRHQIGLIGHQTFLYDDLTATENLLLYARLYNIAAAQDRVRQALAEVGLAQRASNRVREFSRGMQQRLAIARAMLHEPEILFLDEPYTGLDQHAATMLTEWLQKLRSKQRTILLVTHDLGQGLAMADRVVIFLNGRIVWQEVISKIDIEQFQSQYFNLVAEGLG